MNISSETGVFLCDGYVCQGETLHCVHDSAGTVRGRQSVTQGRTNTLGTSLFSMAMLINSGRQVIFTLAICDSNKS